MARIRTLKPEFWADEKLGPLDPTTRLVFLGLISQADDAGRLIDSVRMIDGLLFPYNDSTSCRRSLDELSRIGVIERGKTAGGQAVIQVINWHHQKIDRPNLRSCLDEICTLSSKPRRSIDEESSNHTNDQRPTTNERVARARAGHDQENVENSDPLGSLDRIAHASIRGLYGSPTSEGTDEAIWKGANGIDRERALTTAVLRWRAEGHERFNSRLFRRILETVISEQVASDKSHDLSHWED